MRILMIHPGPEFSVADVFNGWKKAFEAQGHQVHVFNTNDRLSFYSQTSIPDFKSGKKDPCSECGQPVFKQAMDKEDAVIAAMQGMTHDLYAVWPHMVFFVSAFFTPAWVLDLIRQRRHKLVILHTESPYQDDEQLMRSQYASLNLLNDPVNLEEYAQLAPAMYMPHAYDPDIHYPGRVSKKDLDFAFIGTVFDSRRVFFEEFFSRIDADSNLKIALGGAAWDGKHLDGSPLLSYLGHPREEAVDNQETADTYRRSRLGINFYRREAEKAHAGEGWAIGPREVEMAACGIPWLRDARGESDELFPFLPTFSTAGEAADLLRWYLSDDDRRVKLGRQARAAIRDRTFMNHANMLMDEMSRAGLL
jgi:spore maturation protein CgeB